MHTYTYTHTCVSTELNFTQEDPVYQTGLWECEANAKVSVIRYLSVILICCHYQGDISGSPVILTQILVGNNHMR